MAAIGKIRQHYGILIVIIGVALLAFVLNDLFTSKNRGSNQPEIAVVNGEKISREEWRSIYENEKARRGNVTKRTEFSLQYNALESLIGKAIIDDEYNKLGITVTDNELNELFHGQNPSRVVVKYFAKENGELDRDALNEVIDRVNNADQDPELTQEQVYQLRSSWNALESEVSEDRMWEKYMNLLTLGYYMPKKLADRYNANQNVTRTADIYYVDYRTIEDSVALAQLTEDEYKEYYEEFKYKHITDEEQRNIEYVVFDVKPTAEDKENAVAYVEKAKSDLESTDDVNTLISIVSNKYNTTCDTSWKKITEFPPVLEDLINNHEVGEVYGPYDEGQYINAAKLIGKEKREGTMWAKVIILKHEITAGRNTINTVKNNAELFQAESKTAEDFNNAVEKNHMRKGTALVNQEQYEIGGVKDSRSIICWAFNEDRKVGDVSSVYPFDNMYVVAVLTDILPAGYLPYEEVLNRDQKIILKWKKGKMLDEMAKQYGNNYDAMIMGLHGDKRTESITFDDPRGLFSSEERIGGTIHGMKEGVFSDPIQGGNMYAVVKVVETSPSVATDFNKIDTENKARFQNIIVNGAFSALRESAKVENNMIYYF